MGNDTRTVVYGAPNLANRAEENADRIHERMCSVVLNLHPSSVLEIGAGRGTLGARFADHLNVGGMIVCGTPHYGSYLRNLLLSLANRWDHHHGPLWDGGHIKFFSKATLQQIWAEGGFTNFTWGEIPSRRLRIMPMYLYCAATLTSVR